ncbi:type 4a pilus biogenesis protein PilO [Bdellovibrio sp. HCB337]|uniref:type 4a pilus biogenesis protein PilO n=1 Tax=Bdellovibrio sp. HCB337 TaxID=3394358 RepID=UPI0039A515C3
MNQLFEKLAGMTNGKAMVIGLFMGLAYYFAMYDDGSALTTQIGVLNGQLQEAETKKKDTEATLQEEARMKDAVGKLSEQYAFIAKKLPSELKSSDMIRGIDSVAKMAGVSVKMKKPGNVTKKEVVEELPVDVSLEGTYAQIAQFVYFTSNLERLTRVLNFSLAAPMDDPNKPLRFEGQVVSYKLAPEPEKTDKPQGQTP